jgi:hypothetical protein
METQGARSVGLTGGCQCGAIRYRLEAEANFAALCHCRMCQKASGGPLMAFAGVPSEAFAITRGAVATFRSSDVVERGFCAACGTPLTYRILSSQRIAFTLGSLDNPGAMRRRPNSAASRVWRGLPPRARRLVIRLAPEQASCLGRQPPASRPRHLRANTEMVALEYRSLVSRLSRSPRSLFLGGHSRNMRVDYGGETTLVHVVVRHPAWVPNVRF